jgi:hypothetical protein
MTVESQILIEAGHTERNYWRDLLRYRELFYFLALARRSGALRTEVYLLTKLDRSSPHWSDLSRRCANQLPINPRRWTFDAGKSDLSTEKGRRSFRKTLLQLADQSISVLKRTNAQGMITWDPEGEEFSGACYYGDPSLVSRLAPEMEFKGSNQKSAIDEYFEKLRAAGLRWVSAFGRNKL